jgi:tRNA 2-thiouridine synthesizing protein A
MMPESKPTLVIDQRLDARGWLCPRPVIEARQLLQDMATSAVLEVLLSDPHGPLDFEVLCQRSGHCLHCIEVLTDDDQHATVWRILLSRGASGEQAMK